MASVTHRSSRKGKPLSAYPLFPAFVALWFAALLGLSSLALGAANLERLVAASQIQTLVPAAAPPLGTTARSLIAVGLSAIGAVIGFAIGHAIARAGRPAPERPIRVRARDLHPDAPVRRPISAHEEFGEADATDAETAPDMQALRASLPGATGLPPAEAEPAAKQPSPAAFGLPIGEGAERIASAELADLSPVELLERMAIAMQGRLDRRSRTADGETPLAEAVPPGVAMFPAASLREEVNAPPRKPEETEKALRDALAQLQRMTGAA